MPRLDGKTALVTGAAQGIGYAIAAAFIEAGARVLLTDKNETSGAAAATALGAEFKRLDVSREEDWAAVAADRDSLDILVNNAGITGFESGYIFNWLYFIGGLCGHHWVARFASFPWKGAIGRGLCGPHWGD